MIKILPSGHLKDSFAKTSNWFQTFARSLAFLCSAVEADSDGEEIIPQRPEEGVWCGSGHAAAEICLLVIVFPYCVELFLVTDPDRSLSFLTVTRSLPPSRRPLQMCTV